jgi:hypothetical protein
MALRMRAIMKGSPRKPIIVHYDRLCENPEQTLQNITAAIGLTWVTADAQRHDLAGNGRFKKLKSLAINEDLRWREMPKLEQAMVLAASPLFGIISLFAKRQSWQR